MALSKQNMEKVQQALSLYLAGPPDPAFGSDVRDIARKLQLLPLMYSMGGCFAIRLDGEIVSFDWLEPHNLKIESEPRLIRTVLFQGSQKHPILQDVVPVRPPSAFDCRACGGSGRCVPATPKVLDAFVCHCGGLGWLLESEETDPNAT